MTRRTATLHLLAALLVTALAQSWADRSTSATFDELVLTSIGARAVMVGDDRMIVDQPPLLPFLYGTALRAGGIRVPAETAGEWDFDARWAWGRALWFESGNDPRRVATLARSVSMLATALLLALVWGVGTAAASRSVGVVALWMTALHPEVLAHGAIAYNDLAMALTYLLVVWRLEVAARRATARDGVLAGAALAIAFGTKFSAIAALPVAAVLLAIEVVRRRRDTLRPLAATVGAAVVAFWAVSMVLWGGDPELSGLRLGFWITVERALEGHPAPAWLFGATSETGFRAFFPLAWAVKTPIVGIAGVVGGLLGGAWVGLRARDASAREDRLENTGTGLTDLRAAARRLAGHPMRGPLIGGVVFLAFMIRSSQNVGFRYALPILPLLALLAAWGWRAQARSRTGDRASRRFGVAAGLALALGLASVLPAGPFWISYTSEWLPESGPPALLDSSVDWGQGLIALREWMEDQQVDRVELSYFGSALPSGYGIAHRPLRSFLPLRPPTRPEDAAPAEWLAISRTNLYGLYFAGTDPFADLRRREPDVVVGGSILLFRLTDSDDR